MCLFVWGTFRNLFPQYYLVSRKKKKENGFINLTSDLEKLGSSSPEMNEAWFSSTLFPGSVRVSLPRERMVKEQGLFPGLTKPKLYARTTSKVSITAPVEGLCCKPKYRANIIHHFNFVFFLYFSYHSSRDRKDQFIALILKFGIIRQKKSNTGLRVD